LKQKKDKNRYSNFTRISCFVVSNQWILLNEDFGNTCYQVNKNIIHATKGKCTVIFGSITDIFNGCSVVLFLISGNYSPTMVKEIARFIKHFTTYFNDVLIFRYLEPGLSLSLLVINGIPFEGITVCEDIWFNDKMNSIIDTL